MKAASKLNVGRAMAEQDRLAPVREALIARAQALIDALDNDGPVPGCDCEDCDDERDIAAWEAEVS